MKLIAGVDATIVICLCLAGPVTAFAGQTPDPPRPPPQMDVGDLWRAIRHQDPAPDDDRHDGAMLVVAPIIGSNPSTGVTFGAAGQAAGYFGPRETTSISSAVASLSISTQKQVMLNIRGGLFTAGNRWFVEADNRFQKTSQDTYGLGGATATSAAVATDYNFVRLHETAYAAVAKGFFVGAGFLFDSHTDVAPGEGSESAWETAEYLSYTNAHGLPIDGQQSAGISADLLVDTRDSAINPHRGWFANASYKALFKGFLGGDSDWQAAHLDVRTYAPLGRNNRRRLAFWSYADLVTGGTAPYFDLPTTVMDTYGRSARGYREGRFRGDRLFYAEAEYRDTITSNGLLGFVVFANTTSVADPASGEKLFDAFAPAAGGGLRVLMNKRSQTNLCVDMAWGKSGAHGFYLAIQEAF